MLVFFFLTLIGLAQSNSSQSPPDNPTTSPEKCGTSHTEHTDVVLEKYDLWKGNGKLLEALNAALKEVTGGTSYKSKSQAAGSEDVTSTANAPWPDASGAVGTFKLILDTQKIRFGSTFTLPPLGYKEDMCFKGLEVELGEMIATAFSNKYGKTIKAEWVELSKSGDFWFDISFALSGSIEFKNDKPDIDVILSSVTATDKRKNGGMARFTIPYIKQKYGILVSKYGTEQGIRTLSDLNKKTNKVSVTSGSTNEDYAKETYPDCPIVPTADFGERMGLVKNGTVHFGIGDAINVKYWGEKNCPDCVYLGAVGDVTSLGMAVRPSKQPTNVRPVQKCKILRATKTSEQSNCYKSSYSSSCYECGWSDPDCWTALRNGDEGSCCEGEYCCEDSYSSRSSRSDSRSSWGSRCRNSVERRGKISCRRSYSVLFEAEATELDTNRKVVDKYIRIDCKSSSSCATNLIRKHTAGSMANCSISPDGQALVLDVELSVASLHSISLYPLMLFMVWFLIR